MATKVRQIIPMAGETNTRYANQVYVTDAAEASRLAEAGIVEILETGLSDTAILPSPNEPAIPEGSMAAPVDEPAPKPAKKAAKAKEAAGDGANAPTNTDAPATDAEDDPNTGGEAAGNSQ